jgi:Fur family peroxide stress response transcriptional regulator
MPALKYSRQRESIKNFLLSRYDHPTADTVYMNVREEFPNISLGTVYRNLSLLVEMGEAMKITTDGADRFDGHVEPHSHFICRKCHALLDIQTPDEIRINQEAQKGFAGLIEGHSIQYFGICGDCIQKS